MHLTNFQKKVGKYPGLVLVILSLIFFMMSLFTNTSIKQDSELLEIKGNIAQIRYSRGRSFTDLQIKLRENDSFFILPYLRYFKGYDGCNFRNLHLNDKITIYYDNKNLIWTILKNNRFLVSAEDVVKSEIKVEEYLLSHAKMLFLMGIFLQLLIMTFPKFGDFLQNIKH